MDIRAQGGSVTTWSTQDMHISSGRRLVVTAQDELTLACGGGYIRLKGGNVEVGPGSLLIRSAEIRKGGPGSMQGVMKSFEPDTFDEKLIISYPFAVNLSQTRNMTFICQTGVCCPVLPIVRDIHHL
ncbi:DUF2345 domain-containing protein [Pantoea sp. C2G6]|uniref:DUF2345 domain-containing protein n=1 Tax=Pantoea sp. C2G6 TaxID=3243084 RepID=UPI003ED98222